MVRTVVYDTPEVQARYATLVGDNQLGLIAPVARRKARQLAQASAPAAPPPAAAAAPAAPSPSAPAAADTIPTKLVKYVPVEVVTVFAAGFAAFNPTGDWIWFGLAAGALVNILYLFTTAASSAKTTPRPPVYFYVLSAGAFVVWAIATITSLQTAMHLSTDKAAYILVAGAFGVPLLDSFLGVVDASLPWPRPAATAA